MSTKTAYYRLSISEPALVFLATHLSSIKQTAGSLPKELTEVLSKSNVMIAKIANDAITVSHSSSNLPRSTAAQLSAIDPETWILEYGNPEEKAAVEASIAWIFDNPGESAKNWTEFMPVLAERKYPPSDIPGSSRL